MTQLPSGDRPPPELPDELEVAVYRSPRHELMYVYLPMTAPAERVEDEASGALAAKNTGHDPREKEPPECDLASLPEVLLDRFGVPEFSFAFTLTPGRKLVAADAETVLRAIQNQGFYLQMPPQITPGETPDAKNPHER